MITMRNVNIRKKENNVNVYKLKNDTIEIVNIRKNFHLVDLHDYPQDSKLSLEKEAIPELIEILQKIHTEWRESDLKLSEDQATCDKDEVLENAQKAISELQERVASLERANIRKI